MTTLLYAGLVGAGFATYILLIADTALQVPYHKESLEVSIKEGCMQAHFRLLSRTASTTIALFRYELSARPDKAIFLNAVIVAISEAIFEGIVGQLLKG